MIVSLTHLIDMHKKTILIGLGNPILGDDGVGWKVVEHFQQQFNLPVELDVECLALGGMSLMEHMVGYDRAILVDAIITGKQPLGSIYCLDIDDLPNQAAGHLVSSHDTTLQVALELGRSMNIKLPDQITIVAVESQNVYDFSEELTPAVSSAVDGAAKLLLDLLTDSAEGTKLKII